MPEAARIIAARPARCWDEGSTTVSTRLNLPLPRVRETLLSHIKQWNADPRRAASTPVRAVNDVKIRLAAARSSPQQRWATLADQIDRRLVHQTDWPALAELMQSSHNHGHDIAAITKHLVATNPLNDLPAQDLRYRLAAQLDLRADPHPPQTTTQDTARAARRRALALAASTTPAPRR